MFLKFLMKLTNNANKCYSISWQKDYSWTLSSSKLGQPWRGVTPNGQPWRASPIIARCRDFKARHAVFWTILITKRHVVRYPWSPADIRTARGELWGDFCKARGENRRSKIIYPVKLLIDGAVVKDMFPGWGRWQLNGFQNPLQIDPDAPIFPRSRTPMLVSLADFVQVPPLHTACPDDRAAASESYVHCCRPASGSLESTGCHALSSIFSEHVRGKH